MRKIFIGILLSTSLNVLANDYFSRTFEFENKSQYLRSNDTKDIVDDDFTSGMSLSKKGILLLGTNLGYVKAFDLSTSIKQINENNITGRSMESVEVYQLKDGSTEVEITGLYQSKK